MLKKRRGREGEGEIDRDRDEIHTHICAYTHAHIRTFHATDGQARRTIYLRYSFLSSLGRRAQLMLRHQSSRCTITALQ